MRYRRNALDVPAGTRGERKEKRSVESTVLLLG